MALVGEEQAFAIADALIAESTAEETEVGIECVDEGFVRYAQSGPTQSAERERVELAVRVRVASAGGGACEARAVIGGLARGHARTALSRAIELARATAPRADLVPLGGPCDVPRTTADPATAGHGTRDKAGWVARAIERAGARGLDAAGLAHTATSARAVVNSRGRRVYGAASRASFTVTASHSDGAGFGQHIARCTDDLEVDAAIERALAKATAALAPRSIPTAEYTVVLEPPAVSALCLFLCYQGFGAQAVVERSSFLCGRIGERVFSPSLSITDDAAHPLSPGFAFDGEGSPRRRVVLVEEGRVSGPVTNRQRAHELGIENTGHALPEPNADGPRPLNLAIRAGSASLEELVAGVERGLLVTQLHYVNVIEPRELLLTGTTRNGTFWIEDGRVVHAVKNLRFTQSLVEALGRVRGIGRELAVSGALFDGEMIAPPIAIDGFRFTSAAES